MQRSSLAARGEVRAPKGRGGCRTGSRPFAIEPPSRPRESAVGGCNPQFEAGRQYRPPIPRDMGHSAGYPA
jgi:hypothetical protein